MASIRVEIIRALPGRADVLELELPSGATLADALAAFALARGEPMPDPAMAGVHGRRLGAQAPLADGDRVELYRPLLIDPKEARRRRASRTTPSRRGRP